MTSKADRAVRLNIHGAFFEAYFMEDKEDVGLWVSDREREEGDELTYCSVQTAEAFARALNAMLTG